MLDLQPHPDGTILPVKAQPGARRNEVRGLQDGALKVYVTQAPEKGKANKAIIEIVAKWLGIRKSQVELVTGETASQKKLLVRGVQKLDLAKTIDTLLNASREPKD